jgi:hypothetical protein
MAKMVNTEGAILSRKAIHENEQAKKSTEFAITIPRRTGTLRCFRPWPSMQPIHEQENSVQ